MGDRLDPGNGHLRPEHLRLSLDTAFPTQPLPSPCQALHPAHLGKGNEEKLVVCVLEPVQRVLRAVLPNPLLIGLAVQRARNCCDHSAACCSFSILPHQKMSTSSPDPTLHCPFCRTPGLSTFLLWRMDPRIAPPPPGSPLCSPREGGTCSGLFSPKGPRSRQKYQQDEKGGAVSLVWSSPNPPVPQQRQRVGWVAHIVGQLQASHVCDVLTKCVFPIHLPEGRGRSHMGPAGLPQIWLP